MKHMAVPSTYTRTDISDLKVLLSALPHCDVVRAGKMKMANVCKPLKRPGVLQQPSIYARYFNSHHTP